LYPAQPLKITGGVVSDTGRVTALLRAWKRDGSKDAEQELFELVERELLKVARAALARNTDLAYRLDPRELVNEAYLSLHDYAIDTTNRGPFFLLMKRAMRNFLIDLARQRQADKRPKTRLQVVDTAIAGNIQGAPDVGPVEFYLALDALKQIDARQADAIELRVLGLTNEEIAAQLRVSRATATRDLAQARAFIALQLGLPGEWLGV
jgi:RNA polymerase sigma factor (TIGR02999 family)